MAFWQNHAELDLPFAPSRTRARARQKRGLLGWWSVQAGALALVVLAVVVVATTRAQSSDAKAPIREAAPAAPSLGAGCPVPAPYRNAFATASAKTGLPASLLVATAYEESRMNARAHSEAGAQGLLQLMPATAHDLRLNGANPATNILAGAEYLTQMINRFGSIELGLAAYNAGPTAVQRAGGAPTIETLRYLKNVELRAAELVGC